MNSYQRLKKKNEELQKQYSELFGKIDQYLKEPDSEEALAFKSYVEGQRIMRMYPKYSFSKLLEAIPDVTKDTDVYEWPILDRNPQ